MKKIIAATGAALILMLSPVSAAQAPCLTINGVQTGHEAMATITNNTTYVSLRNVSSILDDNAVITWENGTAFVNSEDLLISAKPGNKYITVNGEVISVPNGVKSEQNRILVPLRTLANAFRAAVYWNPINSKISVVSEDETHSSNYNSDELYWLSRIISAESQGESLEGKIAVGNVVLNRVESSDFPNTIYDVIFDNRWGGQFEPVRNGTIYKTPTEESILAAKLCLSGADIVGDCLYFLAPALAQNFWVTNNREYVTTIGCHEFYR